MNDCLCGIPETPEFANATHCQWCGTLRGLKLPEGSQIHVWFSNGRVSGVVLTIVPIIREGVWVLVDPSTGDERQMDSGPWSESRAPTQINMGTLGYRMDIALGFAMSLGEGMFGMLCDRFGRQRSPVAHIDFPNEFGTSDQWVVSKIFTPPDRTE